MMYTFCCPPASNAPRTTGRFGLFQAEWIGVLLVSAALVVCCGCRRGGGTVLGKVPSGSFHNIVAVRAGDTPPKVTLSGVMVEKCPTAGCWFYLQDETGVIKVDTKAAGFVVVDVPLQTKVTVSGTIAGEGEDLHLEGTGLRY